MHISQPHLLLNFGHIHSAAFQLFAVNIAHDNILFGRRVLYIVYPSLELPPDWTALHILFPDQKSLLLASDTVRM
jgi:hypothetical protein